MTLLLPFHSHHFVSRSCFLYVLGSAILYGRGGKATISGNEYYKKLLNINAYLIFMPISLSERDIKIYEKLSILSEIVPIREKIKFFERKYGCNFEDFEKKVKKGEEDFEKWDDYIEWKAYLRSSRELENKLEELEK